MGARRHFYEFNLPHAVSWRTLWHSMIRQNFWEMDYTAQGIQFHWVGCLPLGLLTALLVGVLAGRQPAAIGREVSLIYGMMLIWWGIGAAKLRPLPRLWAAQLLSRGRHAARYVFSGAMALLTACGLMTATHFVYQGMLGFVNPFLDALAAWGAVLWGQAVGCGTLRAPSRSVWQLGLALVIVAALGIISLIGAIGR